MHLIIGLGNPGTKYVNTRHNAGFLFLDTLTKEGALSFKNEQKFQASLAELPDSQKKILLVKPNTFMNCSGESVGLLMRYYKLTPKDITVVHDDLDLSSGTYKITSSSRAAGHNGVQNIIDTLGTQDFTRVRLGIGRPTETLGACMTSHDYVLAAFEPEELESLPALFSEVRKALAI